ncbi:hypothetical protein ACIQLK_13375 [Microbacterium sp. NPDC091382]|uniref:hypothetical protein n=1 Tax=Microbacterium sp. NPDC091382 TaxID=3364210 RepID=UPI0038283471
MTCEEIRTVACGLYEIADALNRADPWTTYVIPIASIVVTLLLGAATVFLGIASYKVSKQTTEMNARTNAIAERAERQQYADAIIAYWESRREDIASGKNWNMPHYTDDVEAVGKRIGAPNADKLLRWLTDSIDALLNVAEEHRSDRGMNAFHFRGAVKVAAAEWVNDPKGFDQERFKLWHERHGG